MHGVQLVLFAIPEHPNRVRSFNVSEEQRKHHHERSGSKTGAPKKSGAHVPATRASGWTALCRAKDDGHGGSEDVQ